MLRLFAVFSLIGIGLTFGEILFYEFIKDTCHFEYGDPIGQIAEINDMRCAETCMQHENCSSLMYEKATKQCFLNAETQEDENEFPADCGVQYAAPVIRYVGCDEGWQYLADRCYLYVDEFLNWHSCDEYCIGENSVLAKVYSLSTYAFLWNVTQTGWKTAGCYSCYYPWITINDQIQENVYTDRDGVPINPDLIPTITNNYDSNDCGRMRSSYPQMYNCDSLRSCLCEKQSRLITQRPNPFN